MIKWMMADTTILSQLCLICYIPKHQGHKSTAPGPSLLSVCPLVLVSHAHLIMYTCSVFPSHPNHAQAEPESNVHANIPLSSGTSVSHQQAYQCETKTLNCLRTLLMNYWFYKHKSWVHKEAQHPLHIHTVCQNAIEPSSRALCNIFYFPIVLICVFFSMCVFSPIHACPVAPTSMNSPVTCYYPHWKGKG